MNMKTSFEDLARRCMKLTKDKLYFKYRALSPAIYRMPVEYVPTGIFGTDATKIYADPQVVVMRYQESPDVFSRVFLHMLFHCVYLHPFLAEKDEYKDVWDVALDVCAEAAVMRLDPPRINGDKDRESVIASIKNEAKLFLPEPVCKALQNGTYDLEELGKLFHMDDHVWRSNSDGNGQSSQQPQSGNQPQKKQSRENQDQNQNDQNDQNGQNQSGQGNDQDQNGQENGQSQNDQDQNGQSNSDQGNGQDGQDQNGNGQGQGNQGNNQSQSSQNGRGHGNDEKCQEWSDVSRQIAADLESFNKRGTEAGSMSQEIDFLTRDKMDYEEFLRDFSVTEEVMKIDMDDFDINLYSASLMRDDGLLFVEPLEYKEDKTIRDFVIAIDTSGSCSGKLVKKFLNKTFSILKSTESFSSRVNIHIVQCDARVQNDTKITSLDEMESFLSEMKLYGFGGTDFRPVFQYVDELLEKKEFTNLGGLIYFTDGEGVFPERPTPYKTAFVFLEDYTVKEVPSWAMSVYWDE